MGGEGLEKLREWLYAVIIGIAEFHDRTWAYNRGLESPFTDKQLHFFFFGLLGLLLLLVVWPLFRCLARRGQAGLMAWLMCFFALLAFAFAVEIGQLLTRTGSMELGDIVYGVVGFFAASALAAALYWLYRLIRKLRGK